MPNHNRWQSKKFKTNYWPPKISSELFTCKNDVKQNNLKIYIQDQIGGMTQELKQSLDSKRINPLPTNVRTGVQTCWRKIWWGRWNSAKSWRKRCSLMNRWRLSRKTSSIFEHRFSWHNSQVQQSLINWAQKLPVLRTGGPDALSEASKQLINAFRVEDKRSAVVGWHQPAQIGMCWKLL